MVPGLNVINVTVWYVWWIACLGDMHLFMRCKRIFGTRKRIREHTLLFLTQTVPRLSTLNPRSFLLAYGHSTLLMPWCGPWKEVSVHTSPRLLVLGRLDDCYTRPTCSGCVLHVKILKRRPRSYDARSNRTSPRLTQGRDSVWNYEAAVARSRNSKLRFISDLSKFKPGSPHHLTFKGNKMAGQCRYEQA